MHIIRKRREILLQPGDHFVGGPDCRVRTVLGSCVSITLWHPVRRIGAMSHFLLSARHTRRIADLDGRYGDEAVLLMLKGLAAHHVNPQECMAKIFGGGNMFPKHSETRTVRVGERNGEAARRLLQGLGIPVVAESLFGVGHRQIIFDIATGTVWLHQHLLSPAQIQAPAPDKPAIIARAESWRAQRIGSISAQAPSGRNRNGAIKTL